VASNQVSTRSFSKPSTQHAPAPATTVVGSLSATPSAIPDDLIPAPSHSGVTLPSVPRKRKAVAPDTSANSSEKSSSPSLIENADMGELIENLMRIKVPAPAYRRIQEFLIKVTATFFSLFIHGINFFTSFCSISIHFLPCRLEGAGFVQIPSLRFTQGLICSLRISLRTSVYRASLPHFRMFLLGTNVLPHTLRFFLHSQPPTYMTTACFSLHTPLIQKCPERFTTGHTRKISTWPKIGSA
jgi:hypothetical protein